MNMQTSSGNPSDPDELAGFEGWLTRSLYRFDCPEAHTLGEYALDLVTPERRTAIAGHVIECDECQTELSTLREFLATPTSMPESFAERARRRLATLFMPSAVQAYGLRGTAESSAQIYEVDGVTITLVPGAESGSLIGLVVSEAVPPEQLEGCEVRLVAMSGLTTTVHLDDLGNFEVEALAPDVYGVEVYLPDDVIVIEALRVG
jgi:hypothetical protein